MKMKSNNRRVVAFILTFVLLFGKNDMFSYAKGDDDRDSIEVSDVSVLADDLAKENADEVEWKEPAANWYEDYIYELDEVEKRIYLHTSKGNLEGNIVVPGIAVIDGVEYSVYLDSTNKDVNDDKQSIWLEDGKVSGIKFEKGVNVRDNSCEGLFCGYYSYATSHDIPFYFDLKEFDTSKVTNMSRMFANCGNVRSLDLSNFNTSQVVNMDEMFNQCYTLRSLDISGFDTSNVCSMCHMFYNCFDLKFIDLSGFNTSSVTDMDGMFQDSGLMYLDLSNFDTSNVEYMYNMFFGCEDLKGLIVDRFDTSAVEDMSQMFKGCSKLQDLDIRNFNIRYKCDTSDMLLNSAKNRYLPVEWVSSYDHGGSDSESTLGKIYYAGSKEQWDTLNNTVPNGVDVICDYLEEIPAPTPIPTPTTGLIGYCGENLIWALDEDGLLTISGTGMMYDYSIESLPLKWDKAKKAVIEEGVTNIGKRAFWGCGELTDITISNSVVSIDQYAFQHSRGLTGIKIPGGVLSIDSLAFIDCSNLMGFEVSTENTAYTSYDGVLFDKDKKNIVIFPGGKEGAYTIPDSVIGIGAHAFDECKKLTNITIPNSVSDIGDGAFIRCSGLTNINIPDGVTDIKTSTFSECKGLSSVTIPKSVTSIGNMAFRGCSSLADVYYRGTEEDWGKISIGSSNNDLINATIHYGDASVSVNGISISPISLILNVGESDNLTVTFSPENATNKSVTWSTSDSGVASVSDGKVTAVAPGEAIITAKTVDGEKTASCSVTVLDNAVPVTGITLSQSAMELKVGESNTLSAILSPEDATNKSVTWSSSDPSVATVSANGLTASVNAINAGMATITASVGSVSAQATVMVHELGQEEPVTLSENSPMCPAPDISESTKELHLVKGQKFTLPDTGWQTSDKKILSISKKGVLTAKKDSSAPVKLTKGEKSIEVYITKPVMTSKSIKMEAGESKKVPFQYDEENLAVRWYSNAQDVATVSENGVVSAVSKGTATITAYVNGTAYSCKVKVSEQTAAKERTLHMPLKGTKTLKLKGIKNPTWVSLDNTIVSVKGNKITALKTGTVEVMTIYKETLKMYKIQVYVEDATIKTKGITPAGKNKYNVTLKAGESIPIEFAYVDQDVVFKSNKGEIAYNDNGEIVANKPGKAKLTAKVNGKSITINVTVN